MNTTKARFDVYEAVTKTVIEHLEKGVAPWRSGTLARNGWPANFASQNRYQGVNVWLLSLRQFPSPNFLTYLQAQELGGQVRKGEHGTMIVKVGTWVSKEARESAGENETPAGRQYLQAYTVFNECQIDGIEFPSAAAPVISPCAQSENAERIVAGMPKPPIITEGKSTVPQYIKAFDTVNLPNRHSFPAEWRFHNTRFHELAHATGHETRLNRKGVTESEGTYSYGGEGYGQEELVAEMAAAYLSATAGITEDDHAMTAAYVDGWIKAIRGNHTLVVKAAAQAQKAADYILG